MSSPRSFLCRLREKRSRFKRKPALLLLNPRLSPPQALIVVASNFRDRTRESEAAEHQVSIVSLPAHVKVLRKR